MAWVCFVMLAGAVAASGFADLRSAATTMACCAKSDYKCAGLSAPDDCCKRMGHAGAPSALGTIAASVPLVAVFRTVVPDFGEIRLAPSTIADGAFKRPHDPPHLHPVALLI
jgi:hypothetical protein